MKIEVIRSEAPRPLANYSEAIVAGPWVFAAGQLASDYKTGVPAEARKHPNFPFYGSDVKLQTRYVLNNLKRTFEAAGSSLENVFKAQVFLTDLDDFCAFDEVWKEYFKLPPARTTVGTTGLLVKDTLVEIDLIGFVPGRGVARETIRSAAPRPLAHYNEAFKVGDFVFAAGQIASDYKTGVPAEARRSAGFPYYSSDIKLQTRYILDNLGKTFAAAGSSLDNVIKAQVFLTDLDNFNAFDEVWKEYFKTPPARTTVGTTGLLVRDTLVEIDLVGFVPGKNVNRQAVKSAAPQPLANYTEGFKVGGLVFAAGQLASDFKSGVPPQAQRHPSFPYYSSDIKLQTRFILDNLKRTFEAAGKLPRRRGQSASLPH
ncbi:MAG TPA: Rid family hydrolase [Xanthobacteraceae bacterium]|jgi:reactive intermediate/imine deaminase